MADDPGEQLALSISPDLVGGVYSDVVAVWHNQHTFTLDFITQTQPGGPGGAQGQVVARVRVPPAVIFQIARAIADNVDKYEQQFGKIPASDA